MYDWLICLIITTIVGIAIALASPLISPFVVRLWLRLKRKVLSFKDVEKACYAIFEDMSDHEFVPDYIFGIDGGGCIVAAFLGRWCKKPVIEFAANRTTLEDPKFPRDKDFFEGLKRIIKDKNVLLVDDLSDKSPTLKGAKDLLKEVTGELKIAVISKPAPETAMKRGRDASLYDYFPRIEKTRGKRDHNGPFSILFPWDVWEHIKR